MNSNRKIVIDDSRVLYPSSASLRDEAENDNRQAHAVNDNATPGAAVDTTPLVARADVVLYIRSTLFDHGVPNSDIPDAIADVQADAIEVARTKRMPANADEWKALTATIAAGRGIDRSRRADVRSKYDAGLTGDADSYVDPALDAEPRDPVDAARVLAVLKDLLDSGELPEGSAEILEAEADGVPHAETAAALGVTTTIVRNRLFRIRARFRVRMAALGLLAVPLLFLVYLFTRDAAPDGHGAAPDDHGAAPAPYHPRPVVSAPDDPCPIGWDAGASMSTPSSSAVRPDCALPTPRR